MSDVGKWLDTIGLGQYADAFDANEIGMDLLGQVDDQMLKDIGVSIGGHRLRIRNAIAKLAPAPVTAATLSATPPTHETTAASAERRQLTVMFCDLVGSTALSARLDPEDLRGIIAAYHRCCTELVERNAGFVAKYMGDGVLTYFGYPQAHEHDAERAVRAGLNLVEAVPKLATNAGTPCEGNRYAVWAHFGKPRILLSHSRRRDSAKRSPRIKLMRQLDDDGPITVAIVDSDAPCDYGSRS